MSALIAHACEANNSLPPETRQQTLVLRIRAFIQQHLHDPQLTPRTIAAAHHISRSYLYRLFEYEEESVAAWIRRQRLEHARRDLAEPAMRSTPIHAIAARWGFSHAATSPAPSARPTTCHPGTTAAWPIGLLDLRLFFRAEVAVEGRSGTFDHARMGQSQSSIRVPVMAERSRPSSPTSNRPAICTGNGPDGATSTSSTSTGHCGTRRKPASSSATSLNSSPAVRLSRCGRRLLRRRARPARSSCRSRGAAMASALRGLRPRPPRRRPDGLAVRPAPCGVGGSVRRSGWSGRRPGWRAVCDLPSS
ncbi:AraC family transcriptional regulator [Streptomyces violaceus]|uniref:AraC family transcriptional regulator n=1 Tax=Streptomyces violaceus TaxID=1936 RepID=UPI0031F0FC5F